MGEQHHVCRGRIRIGIRHQQHTKLFSGITDTDDLVQENGHIGTMFGSAGEREHSDSDYGAGCYCRQHSECSTNYLLRANTGFTGRDITDRR